ncbi:VCBS repeat-containing protein [Streptosporangiaceae bacterium NEAU-GS5]|nr:VCBS repeat-containing protein [Streptosporangiaceae bacterium NEAU-GS5]
MSMRRLLALTVTAALGFGGFVVTTISTTAPAHASTAAGGLISSAETLARAQYWANDPNITYLNAGESTWIAGPTGGERYRRDCSGLVSMAWHLPQAYYDTSVFEGWIGTDKVTRLGGPDELKPGDAILRVNFRGLSDHMELFSHWKNAADHGEGAYFYSFNSTGYTVRNPYAYNTENKLGFRTLDDIANNFEHEIRYKNVVDDVPSGTLVDMNTDGKNDVVARDVNGDLWVYPGTGNGGFGTRYKIGTGFNIMSAIAVGDFNADAYPDLAATVKSNGELRIFRHTGDPNTPYTGSGILSGSGWQPMTSFSAANINRDAYQDLVARDGSGNLWVYPSDGHWGFGNRYRIGTGFNFHDSFNFADFNGDAQPDMLVRDTRNGDLRLFTHTLNPNVPYVGSGTVIGTGFTIMDAILAGDFTGDFKPDVLSRLSGNGDLKMYAHTGNAGSPLPNSSGQVIGTGWSIMNDID